MSRFLARRRVSLGDESGDKTFTALNLNFDDVNPASTSMARLKARADSTPMPGLANEAWVDPGPGETFGSVAPLIGGDDMRGTVSVPWYAGYEWPLAGVAAFILLVAANARDSAGSQKGLKGW